MMTDKNSSDFRLHTDDLLKPCEAARLLSVSEIWLKKLRLAGGGPRFVRLGVRLIRYKRSDLTEWVEARRFNNTAQYPSREAA